MGSVVLSPQPVLLPVKSRGAGNCSVDRREDRAGAGKGMDEEDRSHLVSQEYGYSRPSELWGG